MQTILKKARLIYLPFLVITVAFIAVYTYADWIFFIRPNRYPIKKDLITFWFPMCLPWIPILIWLRPRIKLLRLREINKHLPFAYMFVAAVAIAVPTIIIQTYVEKASGKLTRLETIDQIDQQKPSRYYTINGFTLDKKNAGVYPSCNVSKNRQYVHMHMFYVMPIIENKADTVKSCRAWVGVEYFNRISNRLTKQEKQKIFHAFAIKSQKHFYATKSITLRYLERIRNPNDSIAFREAVVNSPKISKTAPVFRPVNKPFEDRTGNTLAWLIGIFIITIGGWFFMLIKPKLRDNYPDVESYVIDQPASEVLEAIKSFKIANPQHLQPEYLNLKDGRNAKDQHDHRHHLYFFYPEEYQIVYAWTRPIDNITTEIALVAINEGLLFGNWKHINKDIIGRDNDIQKARFKNVILNKIKVQMEYNAKAG